MSDGEDDVTTFTFLDDRHHAGKFRSAGDDFDCGWDGGGWIFEIIRSVTVFEVGKTVRGDSAEDGGGMDSSFPGMEERPFDMSAENL